MKSFDSDLVHCPDGTYFHARQRIAPPDFKIGDLVCYSRHFLKCICCGATDPMWFMRGHVVELKRLGGDPKFAMVLWDDEAAMLVSFASLAYADRPNLRACE